jgi:dTDP-4-amino-4,6-dideoxygalactose transaminase
VQLKKINKLTKIRQNIAKRYFNEIIIDEKMPFDNRCAYHLYWIRVKNRKKFRELLDKKHIETGTHYRPIHTFTLYKNNTSLPFTEKIGNEIVTIPIHPNLKKIEIDKIISTINKSV